jgi:holo-[acyl-carrier protein] synthase
MFLNVGVDMVEVVRVQRALEDPKIGQRFRARVYTKREIEYCEGKGRGRYQTYGGRFAAKEAVMKALGKGWSSEVAWQDIEILPTLGGKPELYLHNKTSLLAQELGIQRIALSITHTKHYAVAYVIVHGE